MAQRKKIAPEGGAQDKIYRLQDLRVNRFVVSIFCIMCLPCVSFLERGIRTNIGCSHDFDACIERCAETDKALSIAIRTGVKRMDDESELLAIKCPLDCERINGECKMEARLQIVAVVLLCGGFLCMLWLLMLVLNLMRLDEESEVGLSAKTEKTDVPKRRVASFQRQRSSSGPTSLITSLQQIATDKVEMAKMGAPGITDEQKAKELVAFAEEEEDEEIMYCTSCQAEIPKAYIEAKPMVSWSTSCLTSPPLYCPKCYNVQYGFV
eukprot:GEMP01043318.1.p1 GENE.GEMP01043318.1~~GEMP01043318.1.p1  ORF type:complete len:266 (+),score=59.01 GEMP01043318.1:218-1015(+)